MTSLEEMRSHLSDVQSKALTAIWKHRVSTGEWMSVRALHKPFGGKPTVRPFLEDLGGSIIYEVDESGSLKYALTMLGVLLTEEGISLEHLLVEYLTFAYEKAIEEPLRTHVHSKEVIESLGSKPFEIAELGLLLLLGPFTSGGSYGQSEWNAGLPSNIEDLPEDLSGYVREVAISDYDPSSPVSSSDRQSYFWTTRKGAQSSEFWFVDHDRIRSSLISDWSEVLAVHRHKAWKATVVLCGGIIEGMLLDSLLLEEDDAKGALKSLRNRKRSKQIEKWDLFDMVDVARELGFLRGASSYLGHAIRELRNLIHPGKSLILEKQVTQREADLAIRSVELLIQHMSDYYSRSGQQLAASDQGCVPI